jgi:8-oxo-dGTP pyrophosphatase MutT (NUDIX family)
MEQGPILSAGAARSLALSRELVRRRFAARSAALAERGDHDLDPDLKPDGPLVPAAVLVALMDRADGLTVLLTRRNPGLARHAGQIAFAGGRFAPGEKDAAAAALREAREEVGLPPERVELLGRLDTYVTRTGFAVVPVVGLVDPPRTLALDAREVADAFEAPLAFLAEATNYRRETRTVEGVERHFYVVTWGPHRIWGATAGMLRNLAEVLVAG